MSVLLCSVLLMFQQTLPRVDGAITGQVVSRDGKPEANIRVMAFEAEEQSGNPIVGLALSDASGFYRLENLPTGRYVIGAGFVERPSYYPSVAERSNAKVVSVAVGTVLENINFVNVASFKLQGHVTVLDAQQMRAGRGTNVRLMTESGRAQFTEIGPDGKFEFSHVSPGHFGAMVNPGVVMNVVHVVITDRDITDLELVVPPTKAVSGKMLIEGSGRAPTLFLFNYDATNPEVARSIASAPINQRDQSFRATLPVGKLGMTSTSPLSDAIISSGERSRYLAGPSRGRKDTRRPPGSAVIELLIMSFPFIAIIGFMTTLKS